jgi:hypothetical protein
MQVREKVETSRFTMICGSGGSKSRLAKAAGAEPSGQMRDENLHAVVAQSTFGSKNVQNITKQTMLGPLYPCCVRKEDAWPDDTAQHTASAPHMTLLLPPHISSSQPLPRLLSVPMSLVRSVSPQRPSPAVPLPLSPNRSSLSHLCPHRTKGR